MKTRTLPDGRILVRATARPTGEPPYSLEQVAAGIAEAVSSMSAELPDGFYLHHLTVQRERYERGARHWVTGEFQAVRDQRKPGGE